MRSEDCGIIGRRLMKTETLYVVMADGWYVSLQGETFVATPDKSDAEKMNLVKANSFFRQLQLMGHDAKIEFADTP